MFPLLDTDPDILELLNRYKDQLEITNYAKNYYKNVLGLIVQALYGISTAFEWIFDHLFSVFGFTSDNTLFEGVHNVFLIIGGFCLLGSILYFGYQYVLGYKVEFKNFIRNVVLVVIMFWFVPAIMSGLSVVLSDVNNQIAVAPTSMDNEINEAKDSMSLQPLKANIHDFLWLKAKEFPRWEDSTEHINLTPNSVYKLEFGEVIPNDKSFWDFLKFNKDTNEELFKYAPKEDIDNPDSEITEYRELKQNLVMKGLEEGWSRYKITFTPLILQQICLIAMFAFSFLKILKLLIELVVVQQYMPVIAFSDMHDGSKIKAVFQTVINSLLVMIFLISNIRLFMIISQAIYSYLPTDIPFKGLVFTLFQIGILMACIQGVGLIERLFGISTSQKSEAIAGVIGSISAFNIAKTLGSMGADGISSMVDKFKNGSSSSDKEQTNADNPNLNQSTNEDSNNQSLNDTTNENSEQQDQTNNSESNDNNPNLQTNEEQNDISNSANPNLNEDIDNNVQLNDGDIDNPNLDDSTDSNVDNPNLDDSTNSNVDNPNLDDSTDSNVDNPNLDDSTDSNGDNPNLDDSTNSNVDNPNLDNSTNSNVDNPNLDDSTDSNVDNPNLGNTADNNSRNSNSDNIPDHDSFNHTSNINQSNNTNSNRKNETTNGNENKQPKQNSNLLGKAMMYNQAIDEEGLTRGKPTSEEPKEY